MTDDQKPETLAPSAETDLTGDDALDKRLSKPVFEGYSGLDKAQVAISSFLIVLAGALVFSMSLGVPFHYEDQQRIVNNSALHSIWTINSGWDANVIRPLVALTLALDWTWGSGSQLPFHAVNVIIHCLNAILVYLLARRLLRHEAPEPVSMSAGLLFLVHPIVTESVNYVTYRSTLLVTLFMLVSVVLYLRATDREGAAPRLVSYLLSISAFLLAWASSLSAWILPFLLVAADLAAGNHRDFRGRVGATAPYWLLLVLLAAAHGASGNAGDDFLSPGALLTQAGTIDLQSVIPTGLSIVHDTFNTGARPYLWLLLFVATLIILRFVPVLGVALLWYLLAIAAPGIYDAQPRLREYYHYLPLVGVVLIVPWIFQRLTKPNTRLAMGLAVTLLIVGLGALTFLRNQTWQSEEALWLSARGECPECGEPAGRLGAIRIAAGEIALQRSQEAAATGNAAEAERERERAVSNFGRAEDVLRDAVALDSDPLAETLLNFGTALRYQSKPEEAREALAKSIREDPRNFRALFQLALLTEAEALETGSPQARQRAAEYYARAGGFGQLPQEAMERYALLVAQGGDPSRSVALLRQVVARNPGSPAGQALADLQARESEIRSLQERVQRLVAANPNDPEAIALTANQLFLQGNYVQSSYLIETVFRQSAAARELWYLLGMNKAAMNSFDRFVEDWPDPPAGDEQPWRELAKRLAQHGRWEAVVAAVARIPEDQRGDRTLFTAARTAQEVGNLQRASAYLHQAAEEAPADPEPWLRLAELALAVNQNTAVPRFLAEAETRNASTASLEDLRRRAGVMANEPVRRIIVPQ